MAFDVNDPTTWPDDDAALLKLAETGTIETADEPEPAKEASVKEEVKEEAKEDVPVAEEDPKLKEPGEVLQGDILAADGKNVIPYAILKDVRDQLRVTKAESERLKAELDRLSATSPQAQAQVQAAEQAQNDLQLPAEVAASLEKIRENWGEDIAAQAERTYWLEQHAIHQNRVIEQLSQYVQQQQTSSKQTEEDMVNEAIAASPKLSIWAKAENQEWFDRAVEIHSTLMKTDRQYAALSWYDRMKVLPEKTEALFGAAFEKVAKPDVVGAKQKVQDVMDRPPNSLSEMSGGAPPERTEVEKLEDLEGNQLTAHMGKLAADPKRLEAYLRGLS